VFRFKWFFPVLAAAVIVAVSLMALLPPRVTVNAQGTVAISNTSIPQFDIAKEYTPPSIVEVGKNLYEAQFFDGKVVIGDSKSKDFVPQITLSKWDGECSLTLSDLKLGTTGVIGSKDASLLATDRGTVTWVGTTADIVFYTNHTDAKGADDGFEFDIIFKKKPQTNQIVLNMETQGLKFYYQPELTLEEIALGCIRPANVVGSYAVYHATRTNMHRGKADADKYKAGKAFHIYRPKVIDASGKEVWADLHIDNKLTITIDQVWLDAAVYPISIDPNFGYESIAGSSWRTGDNYKRACKFTAPGSGTATSVTVYTAAYGPSTGYMRGFIYSDSGGQADALLATGTELLLDDTFGWEQSDLSTSITEGTPYWLGWMFDHVNWYFYDTGDTGQVNWGRDPYADGPSDPFGTPNVLDWVQSIYCTYTAGGGDPDISNAPAIWEVGTVATSTDYWSSGSEPEWPLDDGECHFTVTNNGDACSMTIKATNFTGGVGWTLAGSPGEDIVTMKAGKSGDANEGAFITLTTGEQSFISGLAGSGTKKWELMIESATNYTDGVAKEAIITLTATLD